MQSCFVNYIFLKSKMQTCTPQLLYHNDLKHKIQNADRVPAAILGLLGAPLNLIYSDVCVVSVLAAVTPVELTVLVPSSVLQRSLPNVKLRPMVCVQAT